MHSEIKDSELLPPDYAVELSVVSPSTSESSTDYLLPHINQKSSKPRHFLGLVSFCIPLRLKHPLNILLFTLTCTWISSYLLSLQGGDLLFINENLGIMGAEILVSVLSLTAITVILYTRRMRPTTRKTTITVSLVLFVLLYIFDHGERFEHHGFYNLLVFLLIYVPLNLVIVSLYVLYSTVPHFLAILFLAIMGLACGVTVALQHYTAVFNQGMFDKMRPVPGECQWQGNNYPLVDLLPAGTQNFWAGSMACKPEKFEFEASIDTAGLLTVNCSQSSVFVDVLPETREWPLRDKSKWQVFNHRVLDRTAHAPYTAPMQLNAGTQAVVVRCGASSKIVTRISPLPSELPKFTPPIDDTRNPAERLEDHEGAPAKRPNVMFLFIDAVSHRQFYRRLQKTARALETLHEPGKTELTELFRYHSLGVSTDNSTKAMYMGEIFPERNSLPIWAYFRDRGYVTARVETSCEDWATTYIADRFDSLDFSVGGRSLDYELSAPFCMPEFYPSSGNAFGNFKGPFSIIARCLYGRHVHEYGFDYVNQLRKEMRAANETRPYLMMLNLMEGHEGTGEVLQSLDDRLSRFLGELKESGELEDTVLFLLSDHGLHMGLNFAFLNSGQIEHKNPFFSMVMPSYLRSYVDQQTAHGLHTNEQRLTTPFETHFTLKTLANWPKYDQRDFDRSLFTPVKAARTCTEAGVGANFCMCK